MSTADDPRPVASGWSPGQAAYERWIRDAEQPRVQEQWRRWQEEGRADARGPLFSIVLPVFKPPLDLLGRALDSVAAQHYPRWELCIVDDGSADAALEQMLHEHVRDGARLRFAQHAANQGVAAATNAAIALARGDYLVFLDQDDLLAPHALLSLARALAERPGLALVFSDSDRLDENGARIEPYFKPGWDPDLLLAQNYCNHLTAVRRSLVLELGGLRTGFDGAQDHDLLLRASTVLRDEQVAHIPEILYHWRKLDSSVSATRLGSAVRHARAAVREHLVARNIDAAVAPAPDAALFSRVRRALDPAARVAVIVHGAERGLREKSRAAIAASTVHVIDAEPATNETAIGALDRAIRACDADVVVLLQAGWVPEGPDWLQVLAAQAMREEIGLAGPRLLASGNPERLLPSRLWMGRWIVDTFPVASAPEDRGYHALARLDRRVSVLHGACLAARASTWRALGRLDPRLGTAACLGADVSLRVAQMGLGVMWCAGAMLCATPDVPEPHPVEDETDAFMAKWPPLQRDPFCNPNLADFLRDRTHEATSQTIEQCRPGTARIAVVIVNFNGGAFLGQCLDSMARQCNAPDRIIVVDNASTDGSGKLASSFAAVEWHTLATNTGFGAACNRGIALAADCDWILSLNPDTVADERVIEYARQAIATHSGFDSFACCMLDLNDPARLDGAGDAYHLSGLAWRRFHGMPRERYAGQAIEVFSACAAAALYRREAVCAAGGFDESLFCYFEDVDLGFRLLLRGGRCLYLPQCIVHHVGSGIVGKRSAFQVYHGQRNLVWVFARNMPSVLLWPLLPMHLAMNVVLLAILCLRGTARAALRAKWDALRGLPRVLSERGTVQRTRTRPVREIWALLDKGLWRAGYRAGAAREAP